MYKEYEKDSATNGYEYTALKYIINNKKYLLIRERQMLNPTSKKELFKACSYSLLLNGMPLGCGIYDESFIYNDDKILLIHNQLSGGK
tara:strand:+ start:351 stop:614 length:264 start_codon:yes stop_codon:yes gene_type:complete